MKRLLRQVASVAAVVAMSVGGTVAVDLATHPPVEAGTYMGDYFGHDIYCAKTPTVIIRPTNGLRSYCLTASYSDIVVDPRNPNRCDKYQRRGKAWKYTWGLQFDVRSSIWLGPCSGAT